MNIYLQLLIEGLIIFGLIFMLNYFLFVRKNKKLKKNNMPLELIYLSSLYGINPKKINFRNFQFLYSFINSLIITITYLLVVYLIKNMIFKVILGIVIMILMIIIFYGLLGKYYKHIEEKQNSNK